MFIDSIILNNFRAYKGRNETTFIKNGKNVFLIAGNNGFGKTTYLSALVWCLYGKLMVDVDENEAAVVIGQLLGEGQPE